VILSTALKKAVENRLSYPEAHLKTPPGVDGQYIYGNKFEQALT